MKILIVAATTFEVLPLEHYLNQHFKALENRTFQKYELEVQLLITGVGQMLTAFALGTVLAQSSFDLLLNAGIAGAFHKNLSLGDVVQVISEQFGDVGVEERDGSFISVHELGLIEMNHPPFQQGRLENTYASQHSFLPSVHGLTVNKVHGSEESIKAITNKYNVDVETMEGAAFFYAALIAEIPFLEIRSISNYVEPRNRANWQIEQAIYTLNQVIIEMIEELV
jgi:futalosine hydrolase